jgi:tetratricopeptide (TPR) repeat protein
MFGFCRAKTAPQLLLDEGNLLMKRQDYPNAIEKYHECLALLDWENPDSQISEDKVDKYIVPALLNSTQCCIELKQWHKAIGYCTQILKLRPNHKKAVYLQGIGKVQIGDFKGAMKALPRN